MVNRVLELMIDYNGRDVRRINHSVKVLGFASLIAEKEGIDNNTADTVRYCAILHDIGIHNAEEKYGSSSGKKQETEGPPVARELMAEAGVPSGIAERVCFIISKHHTYNKIDGIDFQILVEADFIVNIFEENMGEDSVESIKRNIFRTEAGTRLLESMYIQEFNKS